MKVAVISAAIATALFAAPSAAIIDTFLWPIPQSLSWGDGKLNIDVNTLGYMKDLYIVSAIIS